MALIKQEWANPFIQLIVRWLIIFASLSLSRGGTEVGWVVQDLFLGNACERTIRLQYRYSHCEGRKKDKVMWSQSRWLWNLRQVNIVVGSSLTVVGHLRRPLSLRIKWASVSWYMLDLMLEAAGSLDFSTCNIWCDNWSSRSTISSKSSKILCGNTALLIQGIFEKRQSTWKIFCHFRLETVTPDSPLE